MPSRDLHSFDRCHNFLCPFLLPLFLHLFLSTYPSFPAPSPFIHVQAWCVLAWPCQTLHHRRYARSGLEGRWDREREKERERGSWESFTFIFFWSSAKPKMALLVRPSVHWSTCWSRALVPFEIWESCVKVPWSGILREVTAQIYFAAMSKHWSAECWRVSLTAARVAYQTEWQGYILWI